MGAAQTILEIVSIFNPKGTREAASEFEKVKSTVSGASASAHKASGVFSNFFSSLSRIAKLRMLRGIIRSITTAFKEGTENIYQYSVALGNADASHFASTMDSLASSMLYMKNSIGAVVAPLLTSLLPTIQTIVNAFVTATQVVAQFFAALGGQVTFTRAKEQATTWKNVGKAAGGAAAAAKEYKNTILSFDEIHALNDTPSGGGGGGGGAAVPDYSDMFEEAPISQKIKDLVQFLKDNFDDIMDIVKAIGGLLLGWKIASGVINFFESLGLVNGAQTKALAFGLMLTVTGVTLSTKGGFSIGYEGASLMNIIKTALGIGLAGAGGAMVANAITSMGIATIGTGVGAVFGIGIALVGTIIGFTIGKGKAQKEAIIENLEEWKGELQSILDGQNLYANVRISAFAERDDMLASLEAAKSITDQLAELADKASLSGVEIDKAKVLIEQLNALGLDGITAAWDEETQQIVINTQEIYDNIAAMKEKAKTAALEKILTQAYVDQGSALVDLERAQGLVEKAQQDYNDKLAQYKPLADSMGKSLNELAHEHWFESIYLSEEKYALGQANMALETAKGRYSDATQAIKETEQALGVETGAVQDATSEINNMNGAVKNLNGQKPDFSGITTGFDGISSGAWNAASNAWNLYNAINGVKNLGSITTNIGLNVVKTAQNLLGMANGGFIPSYADGTINTADIFMANENGNAELIGRIGNRTAVANQGQMVDAMAQGVYQAMMSAQGGQQSNLEVNVLMDREVLAKAVDRGNRSLNRRYNVALT